MKSSYNFSNILQIYQLARDTVVLLLESNPDMGQLLEWVIDRCYTSTPREADACFLALASIFSARLVKYCFFPKIFETQKKSKLFAI